MMIMAMLSRPVCVMCVHICYKKKNLINKLKDSSGIQCCQHLSCRYYTCHVLFANCIGCQLIRHDYHIYLQGLFFLHAQVIFFIHESYLQIFQNRKFKAFRNLEYTL